MTSVPGTDGRLGTWLTQAQALHRAGRLDGAEALLRARLDAVPNDADALHLLGLGADARGQSAQAVALIGQALALRETAQFRCNHAMALLHAGQLEDARASSARALALRPDYPEAMINLGAALEALGRMAEAAEAFGRATVLQPGRVEAWLNLGHALHRLDRLAESEQAYRRAVALGPTVPQAQAGLARVLLEAGRPAEAAASLRTRLALAPDDPAARVDLAAALGEQGRPGEAAPLLREAVAQDPGQIGGYLNLATALRQLGRLEEAEATCRQALALEPDSHAALGNLGSLLGETGRLAEAEALQRRALAMKPSHVASYNDLAITLGDQGRLHEALAVLDLAAALDPADADTRQHRAFVLLLLGRLPEGWDEYEARFRTKQGRGDHRGFTQTLWTGEALDGRTVLLHAEQGYGDTVQFCRYVPAVASMGGRVVLEVQPALARLARSLPGVAQLVARGEALPEFDLHCPLLSLPRAFGTTLDSLPAPAPLRPTPLAAERWKARLPDGGTRRIGVAWAGNPRHVQDRRRSVPFTALAPLWAVSGVSWHSLQVGPRAADLAGAPPGVVDELAPDLADFDDTAAALLRLHAVVTPDTALAHLAGSLGVPAMVLLPHAADWRWLRDRTDSPWYPSARLFRQPAPLDWASVLAEVARTLQASARR